MGNGWFVIPIRGRIEVWSFTGLAIAVIGQIERQNKNDEKYPGREHLARPLRLLTTPYREQNRIANQVSL